MSDDITLITVVDNAFREVLVDRNYQYNTSGLLPMYQFGLLSHDAGLSYFRHPTNREFYLGDEIDPERLVLVPKASTTREVVSSQDLGDFDFQDREGMIAEIDKVLPKHIAKFLDELSVEARSLDANAAHIIKLESDISSPDYCSDRLWYSAFVMFIRCKE